jgi:hypothetical protein
MSASRPPTPTFGPQAVPEAEAMDLDVVTNLE